ncbi:MAG TPA: cob(I)yrinic acid a,c-diamide adenosyltransferase [Thermoanaerobaculaceae bacterium]|nr:cob(I)yrinic acid a,c-diamide adenosyltransferase [Thermoanaerobaculaceae bacterium]HPS79191.1 cob(I)yrinic acid a,c-diamide adenosyltransferase [Thermoanaerobaculaceae bacterium]
MKVYTRKGDDGETGLADGSRVSKANARVEAYGTVDELNATLGVMLAEDLPARAREPLERAQRVLFEVGAFLANPKGSYPLAAAVAEPGWLESWIDAMEADLDVLRNFVLPAGCRPACVAHQARTICRRAERRTVAAQQEGESVQMVIPFLNRLSDSLFVLARWLNRQAGVPEVIWRGAR